MYRDIPLRRTVEPFGWVGVAAASRLFRRVPAPTGSPVVARLWGVPPRPGILAYARRIATHRPSSGALVGLSIDAAESGLQLGQPALRVGVFIDWQNCYGTARDAFGFRGSGIDGNVYPHFAPVTAPKTTGSNRC